MTKYLLLFLVSTLTYANVSIKEAPMEWLIVTTLTEKSHEHEHGLFETEDPLVEKIFEQVTYYPQTDELVLSSSKQMNDLRKDLVQFLEREEKNQKVDEKFLDWRSERQAPYALQFYRVKANWKGQGVYYFNHVHTKISQDNASLKWLKYSPAKTFSFIENFLKNRKSDGVVAFCDHDTDRAFDEVASLDQTRLGTLRGIEWGGATHMSLIGIKPNWELLDLGRTFEREESIIKSRSSEGFRIVNHPFRKSKPMEYQNWLDVNGVEVWNTPLEGAPFTIFNIRRSKNRKALAEWAKALSFNKKYTAVSGSDFHFAVPCLRDRTLHYPANFIPTDDKSKVKDYLMEGRNSLVVRPGAPKLTLTAKLPESKVHHMGETLKGEGMVEVNLMGDFSDAYAPLGGLCYNIVNKFYKLFTFWKKRIWEVRFYNRAGEVIAKRTFNPKKYGTYRHFRAQLKIPAATNELVRAEVWQINKRSQQIDLVAMTNPIFIDK